MESAIITVRKDCKIVREIINSLNVGNFLNFLPI